MNHDPIRDAATEFQSNIASYYKRRQGKEANSEELLRSFGYARGLLQNMAASRDASPVMNDMSTIVADFQNLNLSDTARARPGGDLKRRAELLNVLHGKIGDLDQGKTSGNLLQAIVSLHAYVSELQTAAQTAAASHPAGSSMPVAGPSNASERQETSIASLHEQTRSAISQPARSRSSLIPQNPRVKRSPEDAGQQAGFREEDVQKETSRSPDAAPTNPQLARATRPTPQTPAAPVAPSIPPMSAEEERQADALLEKAASRITKIGDENTGSTVNFKVMYHSRKLSAAFSDLKTLMGRYSAGDDLNTRQALREHVLLGLSQLCRHDNFPRLPNDLKTQYVRLFQRIMLPSSLEAGRHRLFHKKPYAPVVAGLMQNNNADVGSLKLISAETARTILERLAPLTERSLIRAEIERMLTQDHSQGSDPTDITHRGVLFLQAHLIAAIRRHWLEETAAPNPSQPNPSGR
ncbi:hypothetical protein [Noviherbaspirillum aerium]|uniref:hypothetical protein n=1 Tax=Noviherbaspirillum aerium TaxID=2588497 RepID=UPI00124D3372|nr:hypothetical protein [Noviherbaspirillum aerium]